MLCRPLLRLLALVVFVVASFGGSTRAATRPPAPVQAAATPELELVGHIGNSPKHVVVQGNYAYVGEYNAFAVLDLSNRAQPERVGSLTLFSNWIFHDEIKQIAVQGSYAYVAINSSGLSIIDISNPARPVQVGVFDPDNDVVGVAVVSNRAFVQVGGIGMVIVDVSDPQSPKAVGRYGDVWTHVLTIIGSYAYVKTDKVIEVVDLAAPNPTRVAMINNIDDSHPKVQAKRHDVYIIERQHLEGPFYKIMLKVYDISNPRTVVERAAYTLQTSSSSTYYSLTVLDNYLYVIERNCPETGCTNELRVLEATNPATLTEVNRMPILKDPIRAFVITGNSALAADVDELLTLDLTNRSAPRVIGRYINNFGYAIDGVVAGRYVYVSQRSAVAMLQIVDVIDPANPRVVGSLNTPGHGGSLALLGSYLYQANERGMSIIDVRNPFHPVEVARDVPPDQSRVLDVAVVGNYVYTTNENGTLRILDVSNPAVPALVSAAPQQVSSITVVGKYAYTTTYGSTNALVINDIANPRQPVQVGKIELGAITGVAVVGHYAFVTGSGRLFVVDVAQPANPVVATSIEIGDAYGIFIVGNSAFVKTYQTEVFDISTPTAPVRSAIVNTFGWKNYGVAVANGYMYLTNGVFRVYRYNRQVSGQLMHANGTPLALANATLTSSNGQVTTTDTTGAYVLTSLPDTPITITPSMNGYRFTPASRTVVPSYAANGERFAAVTAPVTTNVTPAAGGTLTSTDTQGLPTVVTVPGETVTQNTTVTLTPDIAAAPLSQSFAGHAFTLDAQGTTSFNAPVTITLAYSDTDVRVVRDETQLRLVWWDGSAWQDATETCATPTALTQDTQNNTLTVNVCQTGRYALFGPTHNLFIPVSTYRMGS